MRRVSICGLLVVVIAAALQACQSTGGQSEDRSKAAQPAPAAAAETTKPAPAASPPPAEPAAAPAAAPEPPMSEAPPDLKTAQTLLNKHGYKAGVADGKMGPRTRQAIRRFQRDQHLPVTGNLDSETMNRLTSR